MDIHKQVIILAVFAKREKNVHKIILSQIFKSAHLKLS